MNEHSTYLQRSLKVHEEQKKSSLKELEAAGLNPWWPLEKEEDWLHWN